MFTSHTHSLPITTGSGQTTTHYSSSYLCISKLPNYQIWSMQIHHRVSQTYITHSTRINYPGQSITSPKLRWTGNFPIWGKITVPTGVSFIYDYPKHTDLAYANHTSTNTPTLRTATTSPLVQENDRPHGRPLYTSQTTRNISSRIHQKQLPVMTTGTFWWNLCLKINHTDKIHNHSK